MTENIALSIRLFVGKNISSDFQPTRTFALNNETYIVFPRYKLTAIRKYLNLSNVRVTRTPYRVPTLEITVDVISFNAEKGATRVIIENTLTIKERKPKELKEPTEAIKEKFKRLCLVTNQVTQLTDLLQKQTNDIASLQERLIGAIRQEQRTSTALEAFTKKTAEQDLRIEADFKAILTHPGVEKVEISGDMFIFYTKHIFIELEARNYDIGKMKVTVCGATGKVKISNLTRREDGHAHPHVSENGDPCLGNIKEVIPRLVADHQYLALVSILIKYLESYSNAAGGVPYHNISNWPYTEKSGKRRYNKSKDDSNDDDLEDEEE